MNIFVLDKDPVKAARMQCNKHVTKMSSETANLLLWPFKLAGIKLPNNKQGKEVKLSHKNHPCAIWARENETNYNWLIKHFLALLAEYKKRYGRTHFAQVYADFIKKEYPKVPLSSKLTPFAECFGEKADAINDLFKDQDAVTKYRLYYISKAGFARWPSKKQVPNWFIFTLNGINTINKVASVTANDFIDPSFKNGKYIKR